MGDDSVAPGGGSGDNSGSIRVFMSYRRADDRHFVGRLHDRLCDAFGEEMVFRDIDSIPAGTNFRSVILHALTDVDIVVAMIGPHWIRAVGTDGSIDADYVFLELAEALAQGKPVIPALMDGTAMPSAVDLPQSLRSLLEINAVSVQGDPDFRRDSARLIEAIREIVADHRRQAARRRREAEALVRRLDAERAERERRTEELRAEERAARIRLAALEEAAAQRQIDLERTRLGAIADQLRRAELAEAEAEAAARDLGEREPRQLRGSTADADADTNADAESDAAAVLDAPDPPAAVMPAAVTPAAVMPPVELPDAAMPATELPATELPATELPDAVMPDAAMPATTGPPQAATTVPLAAEAAPGVDDVAHTDVNLPVDVDHAADVDLPADVDMPAAAARSVARKKRSAVASAPAASIVTVARSDVHPGHGRRFKALVGSAVVLGIVALFINRSTASPFDELSFNWRVDLTAWILTLAVGVPLLLDRQPVEQRFVLIGVTCATFFFEVLQSAATVRYGPEYFDEGVWIAVHAVQIALLVVAIRTLRRHRDGPARSAPRRVRVLPVMAAVAGALVLGATYQEWVDTRELHNNDYIPIIPLPLAVWLIVFGLAPVVTTIAFATRRSFGARIALATLASLACVTYLSQGLQIHQAFGLDGGRWTVAALAQVPLAARSWWKAATDAPVDRAPAAP